MAYSPAQLTALTQQVMQDPAVQQILQEWEAFRGHGGQQRGTQPGGYERRMWAAMTAAGLPKDSTVDFSGPGGQPVVRNQGLPNWAYPLLFGAAVGTAGLATGAFGGAAGATAGGGVSGGGLGTGALASGATVPGAGAVSGFGIPAATASTAAGAHGLKEALTNLGLDSAGGLLSGLGDSLFQQRRESYSGTAADPVTLLSGITPKLDAMQGRITSRAAPDLGVGPGSILGGGGITRRTGLDTTPPGPDDHAQLQAALSILKGRG